MAKKTKDYNEYLLESLKKPKEAAAYLNEHLNNNDDDSEELFLMALRDVAKAYGFSNIAQSTNLGRESLYKALSSNGNPKLTTLRLLLKSIGLKLSIKVDTNKTS